MSNETSDRSLLQSVTRILDTLTANSTNYDTAINLLSLLCLIAILNRSQGAGSAATGSLPAASGENPLQKLLGELTKGDGSGPSPDLLMSLLPLLNNPQLKAKLGGGNMSAILGLINNLGGSHTDKLQDSSHDKHEKKEPPETKSFVAKEVAAAISQEQPATPSPHPVPLPVVEKQPGEEGEKRPAGRYLNWKSNF